MELNVVWFILLTVLFSGFFILEGFDYGVGILLPFMAKSDEERRIVINTIGPVWGGNEVWMITAGGAMFAAYPHVYATLFSGFYLALFLMLLALIVRGVGIEFRSKDERPGWRNFWDWTICIGSLVPALLWGVAVGNLLKGVPIDSKMQYVGTFFDLLTPYTLVSGIAFVFVFLFHGALYIALKTSTPLAERAKAVALKVGVLTAVFCLIFVGLTYSHTDLFSKLGAGLSLWGAVVAFVIAYGMVWKQQTKPAFILSVVTVLLTTVSVFWGLFPRLMISSLKPEWSLTIYNASSSQYTLTLMTIVACILVPIILAYQSWSYWVFRKKVDGKSLEY